MARTKTKVDQVTKLVCAEQGVDVTDVLEAEADLERLRLVGENLDDLLDEGDLPPGELKAALEVMDLKQQLAAKARMIINASTS